ncbi:related to Aromatic amino acid aminotransferase 2 [Hanseniaspora guilliermondii]|uniref:Related to Aromatic amino acid aminotransferase 2 n=1 Tax=Hanseniaspora guilliermondii TaxID=56406 RepID=A0A1L0AVJ5_9ASCO|nr:related to Aromatic amino acid aminotransferase 2 [Hanseniaspora guilliermondii]
MTTDKDLNTTSYDKFKANFESALSKLDCNRVTDPFYIIKGLPEDLKQSSSPVYLAGGMPHESMFPFKHVSVKYRDAPGSLGNLESSTIKEGESYNSYDIPLYSEGSVKNQQSDIARAFQYSENVGLESLREFTRQIIKKVNTPIYDNWDVLITSGSSDSLSKVCDLFVDEDTTVLCEEFTFVNICSHVKYAQGSCVPVKLEVSDDPKSQGIDTTYLSDLLENWSSYYPDKKKKLVLYTIATGQNPTGVTQSLEKRKEIYDICCKHNVIILEDDPYGYLQLPKYNAKDPLKNPYQDNTITLDVFCSKLLKPSYMTIDTEGRVLRLETFSKVGSPGLRLGFIAANTYLIERLSNISFMTSRNASGISQSITNNLLFELGTRYQKEVDSKASMIDGWFNWCMKIAGEYTHRRNVLFKAIHETEAFKKNYFQLLEPSCGMFATIVVNMKPEWISSDDKTKRKDQIKRAMDYLLCCLLETGCLPILGYKMTICRDFSMDRANFLRITFAKAESAEIFEQGAKNMSAAFERLNEEYMTDKELWDLPATGLVGM